MDPLPPRKSASAFLSREQRWLLLGVETIVLCALTGWVLSQLDRLLEPSAWLVGLIIVAAGDVATALIMQRYAPTNITLEPGEQLPRVAAAASDFDAAGRGFVVLRGERWQAQLRGRETVRKGAALRVVSRAGLTLVVETADRAD